MINELPLNELRRRSTELRKMMSEYYGVLLL